MRESPAHGANSHGDADSFPDSGAGTGLVHPGTQEPIPERLALCGLAPSPTARTPSVALSAPTMLGVNFIVYVHEAPAPASDAPQLPPVTVKSPGLAPPTLSLNETAAPPSLITVTVLLVEEWPSTTVPKAMLAGTTLTGTNPVPLSATAGGPPLGSCATPIESVPLSAVSLPGVNVTA